MLVCLECFECCLNGYWLKKKKKYCGCVLICKREEGWWGGMDPFIESWECSWCLNCCECLTALCVFIIIIIIIINMEWMQFCGVCAFLEGTRLYEVDDDDDDKRGPHLCPINSHELWDFAYVWKHWNSKLRIETKEGKAGIQMYELQNSNIPKDLPTCTQKQATQHGCWL